MKKNEKTGSKKLNIYKRKNRFSQIIYIISALGVMAFGIYYREIFEILGAILLLALAINKNFKLGTKKLSTVAREKNKLKSLTFFILVFSLINPLGIIPLIYDLYLRDWVINGGLNEEN